MFLGYNCAKLTWNCVLLMAHQLMFLVSLDCVSRQMVLDCLKTLVSEDIDEVILGFHWLKRNACKWLFDKGPKPGKRARLVYNFYIHVLQV